MNLWELADVVMWGIAGWQIGSWIGMAFRGRAYR